MTNTQNAFQSFMNSTQSGESRWWSWVIGFWFAIVIWFYGQMILGIAMSILALMVAPDIIGGLAQTDANALEFDPMKAVIALAIGIAPLIPIVLWLMRKSFKSSTAKTIAIAVSVTTIIITTTAFYIFMSGQPEGSAEITSQLIARNPILYALILLTFPVLMAGLWLSQKFIHKRPILALHTAAKRFRWTRMLFCMVVLWVIMAVVTYIGHLTGASTAELVFDPSRFWMYLPITLLLIPLQSATEEIALRGYLNQGIGHYIKNPWVVFFITSSAFAALHLGNPEVAESTKDTSLLIAMSGYFFFGMFACVLTYIDGGLETAIGMHAANNIFAASMLGYESSALPTPTIFKVGLNTSLDSLMTLIVLSLVCLIMYVTRKPLENS